MVRNNTKSTYDNCIFDDFYGYNQYMEIIMSSYFKKAINPKTGKEQVAIFLDDFYGNHCYGVGFRKDGEDATPRIVDSEFDFFEESK